MQGYFNTVVIVVEFGVHLAELTVDPQGALAIRQLASVLLKQYVEAHWAQMSEKFRPPETSDAVSISNYDCNMLLYGLNWMEILTGKRKGL